MWIIIKSSPIPLLCNTLGGLQDGVMGFCLEYSAKILAKFQLININWKDDELLLRIYDRIILLIGQCKDRTMSKLNDLVIFNETFEDLEEPSEVLTNDLRCRTIWNWKG